MSFQIADIERLGRIARVVVAETKGSVPRDVGASMLVHGTEFEGTIGGGALEYEALARARNVLQTGQDRLDRVPLGPAVGQCCGGAVTLLTEVWDATRLSGLDVVVARAMPGTSGEMPLAVKRVIATARNSGVLPQPAVVEGWMVEPVQHREREIWVWGAGHVGRAIVTALAPLPGLRVLWVDCDRDRFPTDVPTGVEVLLAQNPADLAALAPASAEHLVLTYSHALDLDLCHRLLQRPLRSLGLIGSATKWARFRSRLKALGHPAGQIERINCPIGDPSLGKHPQAIALGVAGDVVRAGTERDVDVGKRA
ncbi:xanthine dehydrogenase accessory protein XdhC [Rhodobacteraceae bacterium]|nr:xanthine dehydrogenase accessory protein XdhC [Paracoccaceae bacterium]